MKKIINIILLIFLLIFVILILNDCITIEKEVINLVEPIKIINNKKEEIEKKETYPYLEIKRLNIKNNIEYGTTDEVLNKNVIGIHKASEDLNSDIGNIILAGHNNRYVFRNLINIKIDDEILLATETKSYKFKVVNKKIYKDTDYSYFKYINDKKMLTLITCYGNNDYRLVITANYID